MGGGGSKPKPKPQSKPKPKPKPTATPNTAIATATATATATPTTASRRPIVLDSSSDDDFMAPPPKVVATAPMAKSANKQKRKAVPISIVPVGPRSAPIIPGSSRPPSTGKARPPVRIAPKASSASPSPLPSSAKPAPKPAAAKPQTSKPAAAKPQTAKPAATKPQTAKPAATKPQTAKPTAAKHQAFKPPTAKPPAPKTTQSAPPNLLPPPKSTIDVVAAGAPKFSDVGVTASFDETVVLDKAGVPKGKPYCMQGLHICVTGQLRALERNAFHDLVLRYGGKPAKSVTKKLHYLVIGEAPGEAKLKKAKAQNVTILSEDDFFAWYPTLPEQAYAPSKTTKAKTSKAAQALASRASAPTSAARPTSLPATAKAAVDPSSQLWTVKYAPQTVGDLVGNTTKIENLSLWLANWHTAFRSGVAVKIKNSSGKPVPLKSRAVLLSGQPGIGKTSAALLVARAAGFHPIEFNASDTRSKTSLRAHVKSLTENKTMHQFFGGASTARETKKHVLIMDEVDGMSSGDRGGLAELAAIIKTTKVPIICMCNDAASPKMRTFKNHTYLLPFQRPTAAQIKHRVVSIAAAEGLALEPAAVDSLVAQTGADIRQILNLMQMWAVDAQIVNYETVQKTLATGGKNIDRGPFQLMEDFLKGDNFRALGAMGCLNAYFGDPSLVPLLVQENYLSTRPFQAQPGNPIRTCDMMKRSADAIAYADILETRARSVQSWKYMPIHAVLSCAVPGFYMHGHMHRPAFSAWLGKYSKATRLSRLNRELTIHMRLRISASPDAVVCDYLPTLASLLALPLAHETGVDAMIERMAYYYLTRDDWSNIMELAARSPKLKATTSSISGKTKAAFTRAYKKRAASLALPYTTAATTKAVYKGGKSDGKKAPKPVLPLSDDDDDDDANSSVRL
ncbi:replication factor C subunit 1 [Thecamonas trahens ATCC 50062]|uniref:Replication factor C subunit 1 n=1 Tax=Thecamonas trahens ATCC 50062 TaxID=461836 RepID=A0A0L0DLD2_THETB|nr:replication factor C subunit 1 [Thecamonas trahens ATCC 50062]KNC53144.1 replication factor C subunit 1 [Thecamonas trahens ATCC 50062]|eukprot:XP_013754618.1 replication factor C subunit 1 [Thecamonas trahens ATCC 50062]